MLALGLGLGAVRGGAWWPAGARYAADFANDRYMSEGNPTPAALAYGFSRASAKWARDAGGLWTQFPAGVLARTNLGASIEPAGANLVPNPGLAGAVPGILGSGGSLPTGWYSTGVLSTEVVALTTLLGLPAIRLRLFGTAAATFYELSMVPLATPIAANSALSASILAQLHAGSAPSIEVRQGTSADAFVAANILTPPASTTANRSEVNFTTQASTARFRLRLSLTVVPGQTYGCELTLACPQLELGDRVTSPLLSDRQVDSVTLHLPDGSFDLAAEHDLGPNSVVESASGSYLLPTALLRPVAKRIWG